MESSFFKTIAQFIAPSRCISCGFVTRRAWLCHLCSRELQRELLRISYRNSCNRCTATLTGQHCPRCADLQPPWHSLTVPWIFTGQLRALLRAAKYKPSYKTMAQIARSISAELSTAINRQLTGKKIDLIIPISGTAKNFTDRGFLPTLVIAQQLAPLLGAPITTNLLIRSHRHGPQAPLLPGKRLKNAVLSWKLHDPLGIIRGRRILLLDDIITTGSTMATIASKLREAGALEIHCLAVARAAGFGRYWNRTMQSFYER